MKSDRFNGNISTNAGGNTVVRYGMTRDNVLGLEAVLADGTVISSLNTLLKNNAAYDLKQLFIGSEGTLGLVTRAVLKLYPQPLSEGTALVALDSFDAVMAFFAHCGRRLGGLLSSLIPRSTSRRSAEELEAQWEDLPDIGEPFEQHDRCGCRDAERLCGPCAAPHDAEACTPARAAALPISAIPRTVCLICPAAMPRLAIPLP